MRWPWSKTDSTPEPEVGQRVCWKLLINLRHCPDNMEHNCLQDYPGEPLDKELEDMSSIIEGIKNCKNDFYEYSWGENYFVVRVADIQSVAMFKKTYPVVVTPEMKALMEAAAKEERI